MKWYEYQTIHQAVSASPVGRSLTKGRSAAEWTAEQARQPVQSQEAIMHWRFVAEAEWLRLGRPYYSVWPGLGESLVRLSLALPSELVPSLPESALLIRTSANHPITVDGGAIRHVLATEGRFDNRSRSLVLHVDAGAGRIGDPPIEDYWQVTLRLLVGESLEESIARSRDGSTTSLKATEWAVLEAALRLVCTVCLLARDPSIVEPDVLSSDEERAESARRSGDTTELERLVDKARRRGRKGWTIGRRLEVDPHYRRPHLGLRWTGEGKKVPRVVPVKGVIVHRQRIAEVPTGRLDEEEAG